MRLYKGAGLPNIWLANGYTVRKTAYGETMSVADVSGLHRAIGHDLVRAKARLTGAEFRFLRKELDLSQKKLGLLLGLSEQTVALWEKKGPMPTADRMVRALYVEYNEGNVQLRDLIDHLSDLDRSAQKDRKFRHSKTKHKWIPNAA